MAEAIAAGRLARAGRRAVPWLIAALLFAFAWFFRFNDPGGSFAGLTDDHFFYLVRGWQILFGDLPVRDFVDHGAPLYYYVAAGVQQAFGRGTLSELAFSVTVLSAAAAATFLLATRAAGSVLCGLLGALVHVFLEPRLYNYPKILVYAIAIPLLWAFADRPGRWTRLWLAVATAAGFLFRHDHGVFVAATFAALLAFLDGLPWRERLWHALVYGVLVAALLAPYFLFVQLNGGIDTYLRDASAWAARDRDRAPVVWPGVFDEPAADPGSGAAASLPTRAVAAVRANAVAWLFYLELALPIFALAVVSLSSDGFRPGWPRARAKVATVAVLGIVLNAGFLRSPLAARLADPSVPHAILLAWLAAATARLLSSPTSLRRPLQPYAVPVRVAVVAAALPVVFILWVGVGSGVHTRLDKAALAEHPRNIVERAAAVAAQLRHDWQLASWRSRAHRPSLMNLALYLNACTDPDDRVFVQHYVPQVLALARRAFAGGHADLRPGFFTTADAQRLTLGRLQRQRVPVLLLEDGPEYASFRESFPILTTYFDEHYRAAGTHAFDGGRFGVQLFVRKDAEPRRTYEALGWPCFR